MFHDQQSLRFRLDVVLPTRISFQGRVSPFAQVKQRIVYHVTITDIGVLVVGEAVGQVLAKVDVDPPNGR